MASPNSSVVAGLTALNQGDYRQAIAQLEAAYQTPSDPTTLVKVQMGLVIAYKSVGDERAIALCETLIQHRDPQIQAWALRHYKELKRSIEPSKPITEAQQNTVQLSKPLIGHAKRLKKLQRLPKINLLPLWLLQAGCAIAFFWLICELLRLFMRVTNDLLVNLPYLEPIQLFYRDPTQFVLVTLLLLFGFSPWLLDGLLRFDNLQPLSLDTLATYSPEARQLLERYYQRQNWRSPQLKLLPISVPLAFTYGNLPRNARLVVTQGLLEQLAANEIATIYATQLGHITHKDVAVMSLVMVVTQLPYVVYSQISRWGNKIPYSYLQFIAGVIANFAYVVWYLLCIPAIWLSQVRIYYSDRLATEITGNPNGLTRALLKIARGISTDIRQQQSTSWLLESWQLLIPLNRTQALTLSGCQTTSDFESVLAWDCYNPYRYWFNLLQTHPLVGDRLQRLARIAQSWRLEPELALLKNHITPSTSFRSTFFLQIAPFLGIILGFMFGCLTWLMGGVGIWLRAPQIAWMYGDWSLILGSLPIGFSIGTFIRLNAFFPDIKVSSLASVELGEFLANTNTLPLDSKPTRIHGKLLGRYGISNWLAQDLILQSNTRLIRLHHQALLTLLPRFFNNQARAIEKMIGQDIATTGWCRRGATLWLDLDTWRTPSSAGRSEHQILSAVLACAAAIWGTYIILRGEPF
ncbi:zinc metalloprotease HtpX [Chroococcidiopsis sp. TS-821]|uniref:zinc metalloprotease HtpX n=1 Tax=Chroococcidiopsis sp. TS-821 TaxID=1378066 RepID=UPI000CEF1CF5|nr:zinc metalloprotease HtpX [Chroococcidiopsis sp. TS-821]